MVSINIVELEKVFNRILEKLKFEEESDFVIQEDFYRYIPADEWCSYDDDIIESGSLFDDVDNLKKLMSDKRPCTFVDFDRLASVLRAISQYKNPV